MKKLISVFLTLGILLCVCSFAGGEQSSGEQNVTAENEAEVSLHAGVKLGMVIREVVQLETDAGNTLYNASPNAKGIKVSPGTSETVKLPWGMLYYYGKVAGGNEKSHANFSFDNTRTLTKVNYYINSSKADSRDLYNQIETVLKDKYGDPDASAAQKTKLDIDPKLSNVSSYRDVTRIEDYSQWIIRQANGLSILIEHVYQGSSTNGEFNFMNYTIIDEDSGEGSGNLADDL